MENEFEEIDLKEYIMVLIKKRWTILIIFLMAVVAAGMFSSLTEKIYSIDTVLEVEQEEPPQLISKIEGGFYRVFIQEKFDLSQSEYPAVSVSNPEETNLVVLKIESGNTELAQNVLKEKGNMIVQEHEQIAKRNIERKEKEIESIESKKEITEKDILRINNEIKSAREEKENLKDKIELLQRTSVNDIGAEFTLINTKEELARKERQIQNLYSRINSVEKDLQDYENEIASLNYQIENIKESQTEIIKPATVSESPVKPNKNLNVAIAAILGLFLGVFVAFAQEWWQKTK